MDIHQYLTNIKEIYNTLLEFVITEEDLSENIQNLIESNNIRFEKSKITFVLHIILHLANNHHRLQNFYDKIFQVLTYFVEDYNKYYSNTELYHIIRTNKRIILFFIEKKIINIESIASLILNESLEYQKYFYPEIKKLNSNNILYIITEEEEFEEEEFEEKRRIGENENRICYFIRNDLVVDFITYINKTNISINSTIKPSIFETNQFLIEQYETTLIEYAAFFGSIQIFKYLFINGAETSKEIWYYAIHGFNPDIIHYLEEVNIKFSSYKKLFYEAIKCHHNSIADYIELNFKPDNEEVFQKSLEYYNIEKISNKYINFTKFNMFCLYDYFDIVLLLFKKESDIFSINDYKLALDCAAKKGNTDIIKLLLSKYKIDINSTYNGKTLLYIAIENQNYETVKYLLSIPNIDVNFPYKIGEEEYNYDLKTPLVLSIEKGHNDIIKLLLSNSQIDVNFINKHNEYEETMKYKIFSREKKVALNVAVQMKNIEAVRILLSKRNIDVNFYYEYFNKKCQNRRKTSLYIAVQNKDVDMVKLLLSAPNINVNLPYEYEEKHFSFTFDNNTLITKKETALYKAVNIGNIDIVLLLLAVPKIDVNFIYIKNKKITTLDCIEEDEIFIERCKKLELTWRDFAYEFEFVQKNYLM